MKGILGEFLGTFVLLLTACGSSGSGKDVAFEAFETSKTVSISSEAGAPQCSVRLHLAEAKSGNEGRDKAINGTVARELLNVETDDLKAAADSFAGRYTSDYRHHLAALYGEDRGEPERKAWYEYHYNIWSEASEGREGVVVYTSTIDYYEGGAHGISQKRVMNFDAATGDRLTLGDVLAPGYEQRLNGLLLQKLTEKAGARNLDDLREKGYLYAMDMFTPENYVLGSDDVTFVYNAYEIAPYAMGVIELKVDNDELEGLWK